MQLTTKEQLEEQRNKVGLAFLVRDNVSEEVIIDRIPYLSEGTASYNKQKGDVELFDRNDNKITFGIELNQPISGVDIRTEPKEGTDVHRFPRVENPTVEQINEAISDFNDAREDKGYDDFAYEVSNKLNFLIGVGEIEFVEDFGGEGMGDHAHVVFKVKSNGKLYKLDGYYSSWEGTDWESEAYEVEAKPVMTTEYVAVKED